MPSASGIANTSAQLFSHFSFLFLTTVKSSLLLGADKEDPKATSLPCIHAETLGSRMLVPKSELPRLATTLKHTFVLQYEFRFLSTAVPSLARVGFCSAADHKAQVSPSLIRRAEVRNVIVPCGT